MPLFFADDPFDTLINIGFIDDVKYNHEYLEIKAEYSRGVDDPNEDN